MRVLGLKRSEIAVLVLQEAALLGAIGSAIGLALGYAVAVIAVRAAGADLGAGMFRGVQPDIGVSPFGAAAYFVAGIVVALLGALLPAIDAATSLVEPTRA